MSVFNDSIRFRGRWRPYQERVLNDLDGCLADGKIHIVAAPGSGKTTVGLEMIRRLGKPALILAPSIAIREQWKERFVSSFLPDGEAPERWVSQNLKSPGPVTIVTYQALYSAYQKLSGTVPPSGEEDGEEGVESGSENEAADYAGFDLIGTLKNAGIGTICLDEAHHLRSEWWKSLEKTVAELGKGIVTVSLTATPPYDSKPAEWQRYIDLCGEIDAEISAPELVKEHNLCPHQDYVYFNWPEKEETEQIRAFHDSAADVFARLSGDSAFFQAVCSHKGLADPEGYAELFLDNPSYLTALMVFLNARGYRPSKEMRALIGTSSRLPRPGVHWMEVLLQGFLYADCASYPGCEELQDRMRRQLTALGHIRRKTVLLTNTDAINRLLITSKGKLSSIRDIAAAEYNSLGGSLRLLILTDYIKKETLSRIGSPDADIHTIGAVPIFEMLRREQIPGLKLGVLSGSVVIIPRGGMEELNTLAAEHGAKIQFKDLGCGDYVEVCASGSSGKQIVALMTAFFRQGGIQALVGTKSLLGEGWDSPCVNALILASFVGSYMLSNQMRGRAIRVFPDVPDKTANIWHLVSMEPVWAYAETPSEKAAAVLDRSAEKADYPVSEDFRMLRRRFKAFLGVGYTENVIQDGIERLSFIQPPYDRAHIRKINERMLEAAADRQGLRRRWEDAVAACPDVSQVVEANQIDGGLIPRRFVFLNAVAQFACTVGLEIFLCALLRALMRIQNAVVRNTLPTVLLIAIIAFVGFAVVQETASLIRCLTPQSYLKQMGKAAVKAMRQTGLVRSETAHIVSEKLGKYAVSCWLEGGTTYEKGLFTGCMTQLLGPIDNPRYILIQSNRFLLLRNTEYYAVPEIFGGKKENAAAFAECLNKTGGKYKLVFTRNADGRRLLLRARARSFVNRNDKLLNVSHQVRSKWE